MHNVRNILKYDVILCFGMYLRELAVVSKNADFRTRLNNPHFFILLDSNVAFSGLFSKKNPFCISEDA